MGGEARLDNVYVTALLVLFIPIGFLISAFMISRLVLYCALRAGLKGEAVSRSLRDILLKSLVWLFLFLFPILSARCVIIECSEDIFLKNNNLLYCILQQF